MWRGSQYNDRTTDIRTTDICSTYFCPGGDSTAGSNPATRGDPACGNTTTLRNRR